HESTDGGDQCEAAQWHSKQASRQICRQPGAWNKATSDESDAAIACEYFLAAADRARVGEAPHPARVEQILSRASCERIKAEVAEPNACETTYEANPPAEWSAENGQRRRNRRRILRNETEQNDRSGSEKG